MEYTIRQVAEILQVNQMTVRRRIQKGQLKAKQVRGKNGYQYVIKEEELKRHQAIETVEVVRMQYPVKLEQIDQQIVIRNQEIAETIFKQMQEQREVMDQILKQNQELLHKVNELEKQGKTGRKPRIWNGKK